MSLPSLPHDRRLRQLQNSLKPNEVWLISQPSDIRYFTGFADLLPEEREAFLLVNKEKVIFHHASFSPYAIPDTLSSHEWFEVRLSTHLSRVSESLESLVSQSTSTQKPKMYIDENNLFVSEHNYLRTHLKTAEFLALNKQHIWNHRMIKDTAEQELLRKAGACASTALTQVVGTHGEKLSAGITELELSQHLEQTLRILGADKPAFPTIVAFGSNAALPHHQPSAAKLEPNQAVLIDFGASISGYKSDMTRTFWYGSHPTDAFIHLEKVVHQAYTSAVKLLDPKKLPLAGAVDAAAREVIVAADLAEAFIHTTGHGVGLEIHEPPSLGSHSQDQLQHSMAITIEPGIYLTGLLGYRYENTLLLSDEIISTTATE